MDTTQAPPGRGLAARSSVVAALDSVLRGVSQVFFVRHGGAGALMLVGVALASPVAAAMVLLGGVVQSATGWVIGRRADTRDGLMGFNGALVGAASVLIVGGRPLAAAATVLGAAACVPLHVGIEHLFASRLLASAGLPVATAPFCIVAGLLTGALAPWSQLAPPREIPGATGAARGLATGVSQVMLVEGIAAGAVLVVALAIASWRAALCGVLGSVVAVAWGLAAGGSAGPVSTGLIGYAPVLAGIALGATVRPPRSAWARAGLVVLGALLAAVLREVLVATPVPVFSWPFLLAMWLVLAVRAGVHGAGPSQRQDIGSR